MGTFSRSEEFESSLRSIGAECTKMRRIQLKLKLFNYLYSDIVYLTKQGLAICGVVFLFFGIRLLLSDHGTLAYVFLYLGLIPSLIFVILFDKAFKIPGQIERFKAGLRLKCERIQLNKMGKTYLRQKIGSVPNLGVNVGGFNIMERESTPRFVNFLLYQVSSLLITFR